MASRKKSGKAKVNNTSKTGSLDAFLSPEKSINAADIAENEHDVPDTTVTGPDPKATSPIPSQSLKRKRANDDVKVLPREDTNPGKRRQSKGYAPPSTYSHLPPLTDTIIPNLLCVFVGLNPGIQTATKGHPYAHPSNLYWRLLHTSGLTPDRRLAPAEYVDLPEKYSLGNTNIVSRATRDGSELSKEEMVAGAAVLDEKMRKWKPEVVCLVGKSIWEAVWKWKYGRGIRKEEFKYGFQDVRENMGRESKKRSGGFFGGVKGGKEVEDGDDRNNGGDWDGARVFVATSTSGLAASLSLREKQEIWAQLGGWGKRRREERGRAEEEEGKGVSVRDDVVDAP